MGKVVVVQGENDLVTTHPHLAREWDFALNGFAANLVYAGVLTKYFWICDLGHSFEASLSNRSRLGTGCPYCSNTRVLTGFNDLATKSPQLADQFDRVRNFPDIPDTISPASEKKYHWTCPASHSYFTTVKSRYFLGTGCPFCSNLRVSLGENDFQSAFPELALSWDPNRNGDLRPNQVIAGSPKKYWWLCDLGHSYGASPASRIRGSGCSICSSKTVLPGTNDLGTTHPLIAREFDLERNFPITTTQVFGNSNKRYFWKCYQGHSWKASPNSRQTTNCPTCSNRKVLQGFNDLATRLPDLAREWDWEYNAPLTPSEIVFGSGKKVGWVCTANADHKWVNSPMARSTAEGCPICKNVIIIPGVNDLATTDEWLAREWDFERNVPTLPRDIASGTSKKYWWKCQVNEDHRWKTSGDSRLRGSGCPSCAKAGYDPNKAGIFYFIENSKLRARKVGITNADRRNDRLAHFGKDNWITILRIESENGHAIQALETKMLRWIRRDCGLPQFLGKQDMGRTGGYSETFSQDGVTNGQISKKILEMKTHLEIK